jgi:hypothetical protein
VKLAGAILFGLALAGVNDAPQHDMQAVLTRFLAMTEQVQKDAETMRGLCLGPRVQAEPYRRGI